MSGAQSAADISSGPEHGQALATDVKRRQLLDALVALAIDEAQDGQTRNAAGRPAGPWNGATRLLFRQATGFLGGEELSSSARDDFQSDGHAAAGSTSAQLDCFGSALSESVSRLAAKARIPRRLLATCVCRELSRRGKKVELHANRLFVTPA